MRFAFNVDCHALLIYSPARREYIDWPQGIYRWELNTMPTTAALLLYLFQAGGPAGPFANHSTVHCEWCAEDSLPAAGARPPVAQYEEQDFVRRFNGLASALTEFSRSYKRGVIDVKQIKAIRKALREFEKSEWFSRKGAGR